MWYKHNVKRNLIDMHIPDWNPEFMSKYDPEVYADRVASSGADTAIIYASNCLGICFWPSKRGHVHENLKGRDIFGETVEACRRRGLKIVGYYNIWNRWEYDRHPEWRIWDIEGKSARVDYGQRYGICCTNTGYYDFVKDQIEDLCSHYEFDGLWVDMIGPHDDVCYCDGCRKAYREQTGYELPEKVDFADPDWVRFFRKRQQWNADFAQMITDTAKSLQPGISMTYQFSSNLLGWKGASSMRFLEQGDYLAGDFVVQPLQDSVICKLLRSLSNHKPIEFMAPACITLKEHTNLKSMENLSMKAMMAVSHLSAFVFIDAINPVGTIHRPLYDGMNAVFAKMDPYLDHIGEDWEQRADVGVYINLENLVESERDYRGNRYKVTQIEDLFCTAKSLIEANIAYDIATPKQLTSLERYKVVILSDTMMLDDEEVRCFKEYVRKGGSLFVSRKCGLVDGDGNRRPDFALADVLGVHYQGDNRWSLSYMSPTEKGEPQFEYYQADYPVCISDGQVMITADDDVCVLATLAEPICERSETELFASAISEPPAVFTDQPCLTVHNYGAGKAMYAAGVLEASIYNGPCKVFINLLKSLIPTLSMKSNAPAPVQVNVFEDGMGEHLLVNVLNGQEVLPVIPVHDMWVWVDTDDRDVLSVRFVGDETPVRFEKEAGGVKCYIDRVDEFVMLEIRLDV